MKKYKSLIILLAVLVVLVVAYVVTGQLKKKSAEKENEEKQIAVLDMSDITSIQYTIITKRQRKRYKPRKCLYFLGFLYAR